MMKPSLPMPAAFAFKPGALWDLSPERRIRIGSWLVAASLAGLLCLAWWSRTKTFSHAGECLRGVHGQ